MEEKLFNKNYLCLCAANFLFFFSFYLLLPVLPFFIMEKFQAGNAVIGTVISCYTLATLVVRPFSGYMMDTFKRKPLYLLALALYFGAIVGVAKCRRLERLLTAAVRDTALVRERVERLEQRGAEGPPAEEAAPNPSQRREDGNR